MRIGTIKLKDTFYSKKKVEGYIKESFSTFHTQQRPSSSGFFFFFFFLNFLKFFHWTFCEAELVKPQLSTNMENGD